LIWLGTEKRLTRTTPKIQAVERLIVDCNGNPDLPESVLQIGARYYNEGYRRRKEGLADEAGEYFTKAIGVWNRIIQELPSTVFTTRAYYLSGASYRYLGNYEKAIECYQEIAYRWPDYEYARDAWFQIGYLFEKLEGSGVIPTAIAGPEIRYAYEKVIADYPESKVAAAARRRLKRWQLTDSQ